MSWSQDLLAMFDDPLLADVRPFPPRITSDDRLVESFLETIEWVRINKKTPEEKSVDFTERKLHRRLLSIKADDDKKAFLQVYDTMNLLND